MIQICLPHIVILFEGCSKEVVKTNMITLAKTDSKNNETHYEKEEKQNEKIK